MPHRSTFPRSLPAFAQAFPDEAAGRAFMADVRWSDGFCCPFCGHGQSWWRAGSETRLCQSCRRTIGITTGTALHRSHLPLSTWLLASYLVATTPGLNSVQLAKQVGLTRQGTVWLLLSKIRRAMGEALSEPLSGIIEADEAWFGGPETGATRTRVESGKSMVLVLAEAKPLGRVRLMRISDNGGATLARHITKHVAPGSTVRTDGWQPYRIVTGLGYTHDRRPHTSGWARRGERSTPYADEAISAAKRWILATYQKPPREHLDAYLAEFAFRREFRDPAEAFAALVRSLLAAEPAGRRDMKAGAHLPPVAPLPAHTETRTARRARTR